MAPRQSTPLSVRRRFLITGGAGYIGSHVVLSLAGQRYDVTVFDNLSLGHRAAVPTGVPLIHADLADSPALNAALADGPWDAVLHFAALFYVVDSFRDPFLYFREDTINGINLVSACVRHGIKRFVLSSTANV